MMTHHYHKTRSLITEVNMLNKFKKWFKSKTINTALIIALLGVLELNFQYLQGMLGDYYGVTWIVFSMIMVVLRAMTTQSLNDK